jgi:hypothetical protein
MQTTVQKGTSRSSMSVALNMPEVPRNGDARPIRERAILALLHTLALLPPLSAPAQRRIGLPDFVPDCRQKRHAGRYHPMSPQMRRRLDDWYAPHQRALEIFLNELHA